MNSKYW